MYILNSTIIIPLKRLPEILGVIRRSILPVLGDLCPLGVEFSRIETAGTPEGCQSFSLQVHAATANGSESRALEEAVSAIASCSSSGEPVLSFATSMQILHSTLRHE